MDAGYIRLSSLAVSGVGDASKPRPVSVDLSFAGRAGTPAVPSGTEKASGPASVAAEETAASASGAVVQAQQAEKQLEALIAKLNDLAQSSQRTVEFSVQEATGRSVIVIRDKETGEEIRSIPSEDMLAIAESVAEFLDKAEGVKPGLLVSSQA